MFYTTETESVFLFEELSESPQIPDNFVQEAMSVVLDEQSATPQTGELNKELGSSIWFREIKDIDGRIVKGRPNIKFKLSGEFDQWVRENVCRTHDGSYVNIAYQNYENDGTTAPIHTDMSRDYVLIYLLKTSNPDQHTKFWKEKNKSVIRDRSTFLNSWDNCEQVGEACFEVNKWYIMNANVLHSIHNIKGDRMGRIGIQVKVDDPYHDDCFVRDRCIGKS